MNRNEPGSRISSNSKTPDHLDRIPGPKTILFFSARNRVFRAFFSVFMPGSTPRMILNDFGENDFRRCSTIFVGIFGGSPDFLRKS